MKKALFLLAAMLITLSAEARAKLVYGSASLNGETKINLRFDYSNTKIDNRQIAEWLEYRQAEQPGYDAVNELEKGIKPTLQGMVAKAINSKLKKKGAFVTTNGSANYTVLVCPITISKKGSNTNTCYILNKDGDVLMEFTVKGRGGRWGSMSNLVGDGYADSGKDIASLVAKCFKLTTY